jgi:UDP-N-acetylmuramoyl-L-alanyl-D-glutamate--2,6-diaminopimelate ligase
VTSHALDQGRVQNIDFNVGVYTHLSLDHLDYHHTMDNYCKAKNRLFTSLDPKRKKKISPNPKMAVINADCPWHDKITSGCKASQLTYGIFKQADLKATDIELLDAKTHFNVHYQGLSLPMTWPVIGRFNVYNCLAAIGVGLAYGAPLDQIIAIMQTPPTVRGRLQPVPNALGLKIFVDFAHTDDALINVLECLRELTQGKIITVFGCGGDRDMSKRAKMAHAVEEHADFAIVTSDNPRSEDPLQIAQQIIQGFKSPKSYCIELDRREAIKKALEIASPEDIILIAGKGHETYQIFAHKTIEFDDAKVAAQICEQLNVNMGV